MKFRRFSFLYHPEIYEKTPYRGGKFDTHLEIFQKQVSIEG